MEFLAEHIIEAFVAQAIELALGQPGRGAGADLREIGLGDGVSSERLVRLDIERLGRGFVEFTGRGKAANPLKLASGQFGLGAQAAIDQSGRKTDVVQGDLPGDLLPQLRSRCSEPLRRRPTKTPRRRRAPPMCMGFGSNSGEA